MFYVTFPAWVSLYVYGKNIRFKSLKFVQTAL